MKQYMGIFAAMILISSLALAGDDHPQGYVGLYMGHSFFNPAVRDLGEIVPGTTIEGHEQHTAGASGPHGSPRKLWENAARRDKAQRYLNSQKIDLLVMTYFNPNTSRLEDYTRWFDYAISQNPDTTFMVTIPWQRYMFQADKAALAGYKDGYKEMFDELIVPLREKYPKNTILYCPYGMATYELVNRLNAGKLPGVDKLSPTDDSKANTSDYLLVDALGHPSDLVARVGALVWLQTLYGYDLSTLEVERLEGLPDIDIKEIAITVAADIQPYNAIYTAK